jgi:hypothetical protein
MRLRATWRTKNNKESVREREREEMQMFELMMNQLAELFYHSTPLALRTFFFHLKEGKKLVI